MQDQKICHTHGCEHIPVINALESSYFRFFTFPDCITSTVIVSDGKTTDREPVIICLSGGNERPYFVGEPYVREHMSSSVAEGTTVVTVVARDDDMQGKIMYQVSTYS